MSIAQEEKQIAALWKFFQEFSALSDHQIEQFKRYEHLLYTWNEKFNITALTTTRSIVKHHFSDSLNLQGLIDISKISTIADIGSGGGFPGIPLKIAFPSLNVILMEVNKKKQSFLREVINQLELSNIEICDLDWRTFIRTTEGEIDLFITRASLGVDELCRMFKPSCSYKNVPLIYWASREWEPSEEVKPLVQKEYPYAISHKKRKLVYLGLSLNEDILVKE